MENEKNEAYIVINKLSVKFTLNFYDLIFYVPALSIPIENDNVRNISKIDAIMYDAILQTFLKKYVINPWVTIETSPLDLRKNFIINVIEKKCIISLFKLKDRCLQI